MTFQSTPIARSSTPLSSQPNGNPQVYWSASTTYDAFTRAMALLVSAYAVVLTNAKFRIRGQRSVDALTWVNLGTDGYIDGQTGYVTALGALSNQYSGEQSEFGAKLRIGIEVASVDGTSQGFAQLNIDVLGLEVGLMQTLRLLSGSIALSATPAIIGGNQNTTPFPKCRVNVKLGANAPDTLTIYAKTGKADALVTAATGTITAGNREATVEMTTCGDVVAVYYTTGGGWSSTAATVDLVMRPL